MHCAVSLTGLHGSKHANLRERFHSPAHRRTKFRGTVVRKNRLHKLTGQTNAEPHQLHATKIRRGPRADRGKTGDSPFDVAEHAHRFVRHRAGSNRSNPPASLAVLSKIELSSRRAVGERRNDVARYALDDMRPMPSTTVPPLLNATSHKRKPRWEYHAEHCTVGHDQRQRVGDADAVIGAGSHSECGTPPASPRWDQHRRASSPPPSARRPPQSRRADR